MGSATGQLAEMAHRTASRRSVLGAVVMLSGALGAACTPAAQTPAGPASGGVLASGPVPITYWKSLSGPRHDAQVALTDRFNAAQERVRVTLEHVGEYGPAGEKLRVALASGSGIPDAMLLSVNTDLPYFGRLGVLRALDSYARHDASAWVAGIYPRLLADGRVGGAAGGGLYQLPFARSAPVLYLNLDLLRRTGVPETAPATWDDLLAMAQQVARSRTAAAGATDGADGAQVAGPVRAPFGLTTSYLELQPLLWAFGGGYSDGTLDVSIDAPASVAAVQFFADLAHRHHVADPTRAALTEFTQGQRAFLNGTTASLTQIDSTPLFRAAAAPLPGRAGVPLAIPGSGAGLSILAPAPVAHQDAAWEFLRFMTSAPSTASFAQATGYQPVRPDALALPEMQTLLAAHPAMRVAQAQLEHVQPIDSIVSAPFAGQKIEAALGRILFDRASVREVCDALATDLRQTRQ